MAPLGESPEVRAGHIDVAGVRVAYREAGAGPALVLLHGIGAGAASWTHQFAGLSDRYRVIAWDAPGYGGSGDVAVDRPTPAEYADVVRGLLDGLGVKHCHLLGHSLGALIGAAFARRHGAMLTSLILSSSAAGYQVPPGGTFPPLIQARLDDINELGPEGMAAKRVTRLCAPAASAAALEEVRAVMAQVRLRGYCQATALLAQGDIFADTPHIRVRTLVVCGTEDAVTLPDKVRKIADAIAGARYVPLPGTGHCCYVEDPAGFNALVADFIAEGR